MAFGILGTLLTAPIFFFMEKTTEPIVAFLLMMVGLIIVTGYTSINAIVKAELFPTGNSRTRRRFTICTNSCDIRRNSRVHRIMAKEYRNGVTILLLRSWMYRNQLYYVLAYG